ncbi:MAG: calcium-binding protein [Acidimicrobiales bacterium]
MRRIRWFVPLVVLLTATLAAGPGRSEAASDPFVWLSPIETEEGTSANGAHLSTNTAGQLIVFATAFIDDGGRYDDHDLHLATYESDGRLLWARSFGRPDLADFAGSVTTDADDNIYISYSSARGDRDPAGSEMRKYSADGELQWTKRRAHSFYLDVVGDTLFATKERLGFVYPPVQPKPSLVVRFGLDGVERARLPIGETAVDRPGPGFATNLGPAPPGGLHYTTYGDAVASIDLVHTGRAGNERWRNVIPITDGQHLLERSPADAFGAVGVAWQTATDRQGVWVRQVNGDGHTRWTARLTHPAWRSVSVEHLTSNGSGQLVMGGSLNDDFTVVVLEPDGAIRSISNLGSPGRFDSLQDVTVSPPGQVYASGHGLDEMLGADTPTGWIGRLRTATTPAPMCEGVPATILGTEGPDEISGTPVRDVVVALGGADHITSGAGDDLICAGDGADRVEAGRGHDAVHAQAGADTVDGGGGRDFVHGGPGVDELRGGLGKDRVWGGGAVDECWGEQLRCEIKHRTTHRDPSG